MEFDPLVTAFLSVLCLFEITNHNKKVAQYWSNDNDPQQNELRMRFTVSSVLPVLLLCYSVIFLILKFIGILK